MRQIYNLDENDIRKIIAKYFDVNENKVNISYYEDCEGYGTNEHYVPKVECEVETERNFFLKN